VKSFISWLLRTLAVSTMSTALWLAWGSGMPTLQSDAFGATTLLSIDPVRDLLVGALADNLAAGTGTDAAQIRTSLEQLDDQELQVLLEPFVPAYLRGSGSKDAPTQVEVPGLGTVLTDAAAGAAAEPGAITLAAVELPADLQARLDRILGILETLRGRVVELMLLAGLCAAAAVALAKDRLRMLRRVGRGWLLGSSMVIAIGSFARYAIPDTAGIGVNLLGTLVRGLKTPTSAYIVACLGVALIALSKAFEDTKSTRLQQRFPRRQANAAPTSPPPST
jgi:hypothetical protein